MVAILIHRICNDIEMKRHKQPNDYQEEASMPRRRQDDERRSPQQPAEDSRDSPPPAASSAAATPSSTTVPVNATMSDLTHNNRASSFEQREEQRSAFSSVQPGGIVPAEEKQDQQETTSSSTPMPRPEQEPLPFNSPLRYYHQQQQHVESEADVDAVYPYHQYSGYPSYQNTQQPYDYSSYYPPPPNQDSNTSGMNSSHSQYHPPYPSYHHQEYSNYPPQEYDNPYSYYPSSATAASSHHPEPAYSAPYPQPHQHHYYPGPGATPPTNQEPPLAVTESTKGATPSMARKASSDRGEGLDLSPSPSSEDDRKPSASSVKGPLKGILKKESPGHHDFEPIPFHAISAIPPLSASAANMEMQPPSPPLYSSSVHDAFPQAFPQAPTPPVSYTAAPYAAAPQAAAAPVAPPIPQSTPVTRRQQQRTLAPSSSGSATSSLGEGGSWERRFSELSEFKHIHDHCEVPQNYAENTSLGTWVNKVSSIFF
mmetsp:Transcript_24384/g.44828  ORF Transcript_24384/g.44828 Transcript_24384/m.44828 type:complete len:483 (+) Transcript_24384:354-1802(+)